MHTFSAYVSINKATDRQTDIKDDKAKTLKLNVTHVDGYRVQSVLALSCFIDLSVCLSLCYLRQQLRSSSSTDPVIHSKQDQHHCSWHVVQNRDIIMNSLKHLVFNCI